jgi:hypothetical protein
MHEEVRKLLEEEVRRKVGGQIGCRKALNALAVEESLAVDMLLQGVPQEGGNVRRDTLEKLLRAAFLGGATAAMENSHPSDI